MNLEKLNDKQREAATYIDGPLLILAGAGSGKTSTMTHRIAYLVEQGIKPYNILAVTFTNKAAKEMKNRVEGLIGPCDSMWILTFHSMCLRILRRYCDLLGYGKNFVIYDGSDQKTAVKAIMKELNIDDKSMNVNFFLSIISKNKEKNINPAMFLETTSGDFRNKIIYKVYDSYERTLKRNNAMDFDDLLLNTLKLFEQHEEVVYQYQQRFQYVMVDEYQDTNYIQYRLIRYIAESHHNLCAVGDDDQCIYQWRGADIKNILTFEKDFPETKVIKLEQNYRSCGNILAAANSVIKNNTGRKDKKLWTDKEPGKKIRYHLSDSEKEEANFIAKDIEILKDGHRSFKDFAILYRVNAQSQALEKALSAREIPYRVLAGLRYYDRKEIKDIMAYMRMVINPTDELSLKRIINEPKRGIGQKTVDKLDEIAKSQGRTLYEALCDPRIQDTFSTKVGTALKEFTELLNLCREEKDNLRVSDIYDVLLKKSGYLKFLTDTNTVESESRIENLLEFKSIIYDYEVGEESTSLEGFMESISLVSDVDNHNENEDAVVLMTMHSAKGLEFPVVFMPGMEDGLFPGNKAFDEPSQMEEERRLCYVGMTRAKELLILTGASARVMYGQLEFKRESQFLRELDKKLLEGDAIFERKNNFGGMGERTSLGVSTGTVDGYSEKEPVKPFDPIKYAKKQVTAGTGVSFTIGDRVIHGKFGQGTVKSMNEKIIVVNFDDSGEKKMALGIAPLKKI